MASKVEVKVPFVDLKAQYATLKEEMNAAVLKVLESCYFIGGPTLEGFEAQFAEFVGAKYCVGVGNGTDAITLAVRAAGLVRGDEVLVPANSFFASAEAVSNAGATPVFVDVDPVTFLMNPQLAEQAITTRTKAILPVHLYGQAVDMRPFVAIAEKHNLVIIEDCAQAHGSRVNGEVIGSSGRLTCYSFYPGKNLGAYGDGGAVTTSDSEIYTRLRMLRDHGSPVKYNHEVIGYNSRLDSMQASVLSVKLPHLKSWNAARHSHAAKLAKLMEGMPIIAPVVPEASRHAFHLFVVRCTKRDELLAFLGEKGVQAGIHYPVPLHLTGAYQAVGAPGKGSMPVTEKLASEILSLPMFPELTDAQISYVAEVLHDFVRIANPAIPAGVFATAGAH